MDDTCYSLSTNEVLNLQLRTLQFTLVLHLPLTPKCECEYFLARRGTPWSLHTHKNTSKELVVAPYICCSHSIDRLTLGKNCPHQINLKWTDWFSLSIFITITKLICQSREVCMRKHTHKLIRSCVIASTELMGLSWSCINNFANNVPPIDSVTSFPLSNKLVCHSNTKLRTIDWFGDTSSPWPNESIS